MYRLKKFRWPANFYASHQYLFNYKISWLASPGSITSPDTWKLCKILINIRKLGIKLHHFFQVELCRFGIHVVVMSCCSQIWQHLSYCMNTSGNAMKTRVFSIWIFALKNQALSGVLLWSRICPALLARAFSLGETPQNVNYVHILQPIGVFVNFEENELSHGPLWTVLYFRSTGTFTRGIGMTETRLVWLLSMPRRAEVNSAMQSLFAGAFYTTGDQHKDVSNAGQIRDQICLKLY